MLTAPTRGSYHIIDGQQRLATITMLFCVARDIILEDLKGTQPPSGFDKINELIKNTHLEKHTSWKLELNDTDKEFFREIQEFEDESKTQIERILESKPKIQSLRFLRDNYIFLHSKITDALYTNFWCDKMPDVDNLSDDERRKLRIKNHPTLLYFLTHLRENNYLIQIIVSHENSAFQIFETLNERGQTLAKSNLIKNHILNRVDTADMQREQSDKWNKIFDEVIGNDQSDDDFIMESYHSRYCDENSLRTTTGQSAQNAQPMLKKNLYKIIKRMVTDEDTCRKFIEELKRDAEFLSKLYDPSGYDVDDASEDDICALKALKAKYIRIPILAAYRKWSNNSMTEYTNLVKLLVKFFFKIRVVSEVHPGHIEDVMEKITKMINKGESFENIHKVIKDEDKLNDFKHDFVKRFASGPHNDAAKYVLQKITIHLGPPYGDIRPIDKPTLEHVLPKKSKPEYWDSQDFNGDTNGYSKRLGNMTLLEKAINSKIRDLPFLIKRDHKDKDGNDDGYKRTSLKINTNTVVNYDSWTASVIEERERKFAEYADEIWKID